LQYYSKVMKGLKLPSLIKIHRSAKQHTSIKRIATKSQAIYQCHVLKEMQHPQQGGSA
jgi:hypothetical protein